MQIRHSGTVHVAAPPEQSFPLFTAAGEKTWVPGWDPHVMWGGNGNQPGAVWTTTVRDETTIWIVVDFDVEGKHARYARITPGVKAGTVEVTVRGDGRGASDVEVTYELTALGEAGKRDLEAFGDKQFAEMLAEWQDLIRQAEIDFSSLVVH